jgi:hypothetical protein|tara:strand:- start:1752 stop:2276 length:525 start_codon:yes stop_codon:yes gene_type:complete
MTSEFFHDQMARLIGLRFVPSDMTTHWEALRDLPDDVLTAAVTRAGRTRVEFPTPYELRQDADRIRTDTPPPPDESTALEEPYTIVIPQSNTSVLVTHEHTYHCEDCRDTGWYDRWCGDVALKPPWMSVQVCKRYDGHAAHGWMEPCVCASHNPALIRKQTNQQQYAEKHTHRK